MDHLSSWLTDYLLYQDSRIGDFPSQNVAPSLPGRLNTGPPLPGGAFGHSPGVPQYPNTASARPPVAMTGPSDPINLSAAEMYRQKHEVTATVCIYNESPASTLLEKHI